MTFCGSRQRDLALGVSFVSIRMSNMIFFALKIKKRCSDSCLDIISPLLQQLASLKLWIWHKTLKTIVLLLWLTFFSVFRSTVIPLKIFFFWSGIREFNCTWEHNPHAYEVRRPLEHKINFLVRSKTGTLREFFHQWLRAYQSVIIVSCHSLWLQLNLEIDMDHPSCPSVHAREWNRVFDSSVDSMRKHKGLTSLWTIIIHECTVEFTEKILSLSPLYGNSGRWYCGYRIRNLLEGSHSQEVL